MRIGWIVSGILLAGCTTVEAQTADLEQQVQSFFEKHDADQDGVLDRSEFPQTLRRLVRQIDSNSDGVVTVEEDLAFRRARRQRQQKNSPAPGTEIRRDVPYVLEGHDRQKLDLYLPPGKVEQPRPLVVWIHGGGWRQGDKQRCPAAFLTRHGFAVASVNYRLSSDAVFPAQIQDCQAAIRFLKRNSEKFGWDQERIGVWGSSAGGHLVSLLGTCDNHTFGQANAKTTSRVAAVCDYFGPIDLLQMNQQAGAESQIDHDAADSPESRLLGGALPSLPDKAKQASPASYISKDDPPFLIVHGDADRLVPVEQSRNFHQQLKAQGVESRLVIVKGGGHGGFDQTEDVLAFFQATLKSEDEASRN